MSKTTINQILSEYGIEVKEILANIGYSLEKAYTVIAYSSKMEGLGNSGSDVDLYVITKTSTTRPIEMPKIKGLIFDIEYWSESEIKQVSEAKAESKFLKMLHRLNIGDVLYNSEYASQIRQLVDAERIKEKALNICLTSARALLDDSVKMFQAEDYACALVCGRRALEEAISAYCTFNGRGNINPKWNAKLIVDNRAFGDKYLLDTYLEQIYCCISEENQIEFIHELIDFIHYIVAKCELPEFN